MLCFIMLVALITFLVANGYAADHFGEYLNEGATAEYSEATGWRVITGYIMIFGFFVFLFAKYGKSFSNDN